jgi:site-specific DNA-cytosine methylase
VLFLEITRILQHRAPKAFLLENVPGLLNCGGGMQAVRLGGEGGGDGGDDGEEGDEVGDDGARVVQGDADDPASVASIGTAMQEIVTALRDSCGRGYKVMWRTFNSRSKTAQRRNRLYIVGFRRDVMEQAADTAAADGDATTATPDSASGLDHSGCSADTERGGDVSGGGGGISGGSVGFVWPSELSCDAGLTASTILETEEELASAQPDLLRAITLSEKQWEKVQQSRTFKTRLAKRMVWPDRHTQAVISSYHQDLKGWTQVVPRPPPHRPRFLTPRECARLQGFPDSFHTSRRAEDQKYVGRGSGGMNEWWRFYKCIGNAVAPPVIASIGKAMLDTLNAAHRSIRRGGGSSSDPRVGIGAHAN